ncbi:MAG: TylF/MycF/NovP-related O-methyltransferase, partial [Pseudomonadota bacterium]
GDRAARFGAALDLFQDIFGSVYAQDNLIGLQRSAGFEDDPRFRAAFDAHARTDQEKSLMWRLHTLIWAAENCLDVSGDFVECGVWHGFSFAVITEYLRFETVKKQLYLYDTFRGIPDALNSENRSNKVYQLEAAADPDATVKQVREVFARFPNVEIVQGIVPDTLAEACPDAISFLHLDMNSAASEIAALEHLYDRLSPGAMVILDDYGWTGYAAQKQAEDAFFAAKGQLVLELPTGQGLVLKR